MDDPPPSDAQPSFQQPISGRFLEIPGMPLGAMGREALQPDLQIATVISEALQEVRRVIMIEDPRSSLLLMMDGRSGQALVVQTPLRAKASDQRVTQQSQQQMALTGANAMANPVAPTADPALMTKDPLRLVLKEVLLAPAAIATYILILLCWAAWRYVLSRYA